MPPRSSNEEPADKALFALALGLLLFCFVSGGSSQQDGVGLVAAELLAIPTAMLALWRASARGCLRGTGLALAALVLIVAVPALQLLPVPEGIWQWGDFRRALALDLKEAGVPHVDWRWSLAPHATEHGLWGLLPAVALFLAVLGGPAAHARRWLAVVVVLATANLLLAIAQLGLPQDSILNPFPDVAPAMTGVFANKNHQASLLAIGAVVALTLLLDNSAGQRRHPMILVGWGSAAAVLALCLPLANSRAGVVVGLLAGACAVASSGLLAEGSAMPRRVGVAILAAAGALFAVGMYGAMAWMQYETEAEEARPMLAAATLRLADEAAPLGSGVGSFVAAFQQGGGEATLLPYYINAAHNEYLQWWLEGGVLALLVMLAVLAALLQAGVRLLRLPAGRSRSRVTGLAALAGLLVLLFHSTVDYPLRTQALAAVAALLAGVAAVASVRSGRP